MCTMICAIKIYEACFHCIARGQKIINKPMNEIIPNSRRLLKTLSTLKADSHDISLKYDVENISEWDENNYGKDAQRRFIDWARLKIKAGNGGDGKAHLKRGRGFLGPDGGDGGKGGDVIIAADLSVKQLKGLKRHYRAQDGGNGLVDYGKGKKGKDLIIKVPIGTVVRHEDSKELIADLDTAQCSHIIAAGGNGGLGNANFKSSTDQRTLQSTPGEPGQEIFIEIELKSIADVGLVGFPNAGKSTLLRALSRAKPAVASYPFTTLKPNIGVIMYKDLVQIADIPGLVKDAHLNKGLGFSFLRHVERCSSLLYVIDISDDDFLDRYLILRNELRLYKPALLDLPTIIVANKMDLIENHDERVQSLEFQTRAQVVAISGKNLTNTENLKTIIRRLVSSVKQS